VGLSRTVRKLTIWDDKTKQKFLYDVKTLKASINVIAELNDIPIGTGHDWAKKSGLMKDRPSYARARAQPQPQRRTHKKEHQETQALMNGWK